jgi:outer membrane protein assembly factor BamB
MKRYAWCLALVLAGAAVFTGSAASFDWPQWQGPYRNAVSKERGLLKEWPKEGPALAWKVQRLGGGYSAPSVAAGRIFGMSNRDDGEVVWALSESNGKTMWVTRLGPAVQQRAPQGREGPGCTPTVDGERLYALGLGGDLACLQVRDGKIQWQRSLTRDCAGASRTGVTANRPSWMGRNSFALPAAPTRPWSPSTS